MNFIEEIKNHYTKWNKTRRRIADMILADPAQCAFLSIREFAEAANTTDVTLSSFCKSLGYSSFANFKKALQSYVLEWHNPSERMRVIASSPESADTFYSMIANTEKVAVESVFKLNSADSILLGISMIKNAKRIFVVSHSASRHAAEYLKSRFLAFGIEIIILELEEINTCVKRIFSGEIDSTLIISIATPPYGSSTIAFSKLCKEKEIRILGITNDIQSPIYSISDFCFICPSLEHFGSLTNSYVSFFALVDALSFFYYFGVDPENTEANRIEAEYSSLIKSMLAETN